MYTVFEISVKLGYKTLRKYYQLSFIVYNRNLITVQDHNPVQGQDPNQDLGQNTNQDQN